MLRRTKVTQQQLPGNKVKLSIKVPAKIVKRSEAKITAGLTKLIGKVPGFPANKPLPLGLVMDRCGGPKKFAIAVLEDVMLLSYQQARPTSTARLPALPGLPCHCTAVLPAPHARRFPASAPLPCLPHLHTTALPPHRCPACVHASCCSHCQPRPPTSARMHSCLL